MSLLGFAWLLLITYSALATHATVSSAITAIERNGTWKMEGRANLKAELGAVEQRLAALSEPKVPRPSGALRAALVAERVPPDVWSDSQECLNIRDDKYFQKACAKVLELRRELAASEGYEQLESRASRLRQGLAAAPILATTDPLPEAFAATIGRLVPMDGRVGVAVLLTLVVEIMSCLGLAALRVLREGHRWEEVRPASRNGRPWNAGTNAKTSLPAPTPKAQIFSRELPENVPQLSPRSARIGTASGQGATPMHQTETPSNVLPMRGPLPKRRSLSARSSPSGTHAPEFAEACLRCTPGLSLSAREVRSRYEAWCAERGLVPLSQQKFGADLKRLGFAKWKSCGLIRYQDLQLAA